MIVCLRACVECVRVLQWTCCGDFLPANRIDFETVKSQLESERANKGIVCCVLVCLRAYVECVRVLVCLCAF